MVLILGGSASGKMSFARALARRMGFGPDDSAVDAAICAQANRILSQDQADPETIAAYPIVLAEIRNEGLLAQTAAERRAQEQAGRNLKFLADEATCVVRVHCGIPVIVKGRLPRSERNVMQLVIMRHGQTQGNLEHRYVGSNDEPLCDEGRRLALAAGVHPEVDRVLVSPLSRARETARICFPGAEQVPVSDLREMNFGDFEGKTYAELGMGGAYQIWVDGNCEGACPNGESRKQFQERVTRAVADLLRQAKAENDARVVIVAHGGTILASFASLADEPRDYFDWGCKNCEGWMADVVFPDGNPVLTNCTHFENLDFLNAEA